MFSLFILAVVIATATLPFSLTILMPKLRLQGSLPFLPVLAAAFFLMSYSLPAPVIGQSDTFVQHFVGGGLYTACLFVYFKQIFNWKYRPLLMLIFLFGWVSAFGAANELFELALNQLNLTNMNISDTNWDILANSLGALVGYTVLSLVLPSSSKRS